jgi:hypothetical protein
MGSTAWNCVTKQLNLNLKSQEKISVLPKNYDILCICTDELKSDEISLYIEEVVEEIRNKLKSKFKNQKFKIETNFKIDDDDVYNFELIRNYVPSFSQKLDDEYKDCYLFPNCKSIGIVMNDQIEIFYFQIIQSKNKDITKFFHDNLIMKECELIPNIYGLNLTGLYLFLEMITEKRKKEIDVDFHRREIVRKILQNQNKKMYELILNIYKLYFDDRRDYKSKLDIMQRKYLTIN